MRRFGAAVFLILSLFPSVLTGAEENVSFSLTSVSVRIAEGLPLSVNLRASCAGELIVSDAADGTELGHTRVAEGTNSLAVQLSRSGSPLQAGEYRVTLTLVSVQGISSPSRALTIHLEGDAPQEAETAEPASAPEPEENLWDFSLLKNRSSASLLSSFAAVTDTEDLSLEHPVYAGNLRASVDENNYWTMRLGDLSDEQAIWDIMMQPITILDDHKHSAKETYKLRKTPDSSTARDNVVGEVTFRSQGVHVVENLDSGWTLVEVYNTSYGNP